MWHASWQLSLRFYSPSMKVMGSGSDHVGAFTINGIYSRETNRLDLTKTYESSTDDSSQNLERQVTIQLIWNTQERQFEGKWSVQTGIYHHNAVFEYKLSRTSIESSTDGKFNVDSFDPEVFNGNVTREDYLHFLSKTNPLLKRLHRYRCLLIICVIIAVFLCMVIISGSVFCRIYFDFPEWTFIPVELFVS
jgi:hypothetical protein